MNKKLLIIFLIMVLGTISCTKEHVTLYKKYGNIVTKYTEIKELVSKEVNDTFYIYIRLPKYYQEENKTYPVLYLLDGDISFNLAVSIVKYLQFGKEVPDLIIVAPGYGTLLSDKEINYRERDYTISKIQRFEGSGNAEKYLRFLKNELIPLIDSNYRSNNTRVLNGFSLGGLFALNTLLEDPYLFNFYIAGSPYVIEDFDQINRKIQNCSGFSTEIRLFVSVGELEKEESYQFPIIKLVEKFEKIKGLNLKFSRFEDATHFSSPSQAMTNGLKFVFYSDSEEP